MPKRQEDDEDDPGVFFSMIDKDEEDIEGFVENLRRVAAKQRGEEIEDES